MANSPAGLVFCDNIGNGTNNLQGCYLNDQASSSCQSIFDPNGPYMGKSCQKRSCLAGCQRPDQLYRSLGQDDLTGNNQAVVQRYLSCANLPAIVSYSNQSLLSPNLSSSIGSFITPNPTVEDLQGVTLAVTQCLTSTCRNARNTTSCRDPCSSVNLLTNNTSPNIQGLNECLHTLCNGNYSSLPYADADVIGIGVSRLNYSISQW